METLKTICTILQTVVITLILFLFSAFGGAYLFKTYLAPAPQSVQQLGEPVETVKAPVPAPEPAGQKEEQKQDTPKESAPPVYSWNLATVSTSSVPGKQVANYLKEYTEVMDKNLATIDELLKSDRKDLNRAVLSDLRKRFEKQKQQIVTDAHTIMRRLVKTAIESSPFTKSAFIEDTAFTYLPKELDKTQDIIPYLDLLKMSLPAVPEPVKFDLPPVTTDSPDVTQAPPSKKAWRARGK